MDKQILRPWFYALVISTALLSMQCATVSQLNIISTQEEVALGLQFSQEVEYTSVRLMVSNVPQPLQALLELPEIALRKFDKRVFRPAFVTWVAQCTVAHIIDRFLVRE